MNRVVAFALALSSAALSACASGPQQVATPVASQAEISSGACMAITNRANSNEQTAPAADNIQILNVTPPEGSRLHKSSVLVVNLTYDVKDFDSGQYIVLAQFDTNTNGRSMDGKFNSYPHMKYARGSYRLCFPLENVWNEPDVKRPFSVQFRLNKIDDEHHNHTVARTDRLSFSAN